MLELLLRDAEVVLRPLGPGSQRGRRLLALRDVGAARTLQALLQGVLCCPNGAVDHVAERDQLLDRVAAAAVVLPGRVVVALVLVPDRLEIARPGADGSARCIRPLRRSHRVAAVIAAAADTG